jgi:hypothetical protein
MRNLKALRKGSNTFRTTLKLSVDIKVEMPRVAEK